MRVLVTGAGGQLGTELVDLCVRSGDDVSAATRADLDVGDRNAVEVAIGLGRFDAVVNAAAFTAVDACESDGERAHRDNALACRWLADACRRSGTHLVHVSTDYVFDGTKADAYHEWDRPNPTSVYGASKWAGEEETRTHLPGATVARSAWIVGAHGRNMLKTVLSLRHQPELRFVDDQRGSPTFTADLAATLRLLATERLPGTYHVTNAGATSWFGFVRDVLEMAGADPDRVVPITTADLDPPRPAPRPANSVLDNAALRMAGVPALPHYRASLEPVVARLLADEGS